MKETEVIREELSKKISEMPEELLPELAQYVDYLLANYASLERRERKRTASEFLLAIAGIGESEETDVSERDEEILASEIDPIRGWMLHPNSPK